jgi:cytochrome c553
MTTRTKATAAKAASLVAAGLLAGWAHAQPADESARVARYLAANCANCHGTTGSAQGSMPSLAGQQKSYIVEQMKAFRDGKRPATIMHQLAKGYTDQQIELVAEHFSRQKPAR